MTALVVPLLASSSHPRWSERKLVELIVPSEDGYLAIDDSVMDKAGSERIEVAECPILRTKTRYHYGYRCGHLGIHQSGARSVLDTRLPDLRQGNGRQEENCSRSGDDRIRQTMHELHPERAPFTTVLIDAGYTCKRMQYVVRKEKIFYGVMPKSRKVSYLGQEIDEKTGKAKAVSEHVGDLDWDTIAALRQYGITVCIEDLPNDKPLRLFRMTAKHRTEYIVTNDVRVETTEAAKQVGGFRWKIEQFHREVKQLTGVAKCQANQEETAEPYLHCICCLASAQRTSKPDEDYDVRGQTYSLTGIPEAALEESGLPILRLRILRSAVSFFTIYEKLAWCTFLYFTSRSVRVAGASLLSFYMK